MSKIISNLQTWLLLVLLSLFILGLDKGRLLNWPKQWIYYLTNPISFGLYRSSQLISKQFYFVYAARLSAKQNSALKIQIGKLLSENASLRSKLAETEAQLSQQSHLDPKTYNLVAARPIGLSRFLKIDKGFLSNIKVGQAVIFQDNFIGRIAEVSEGSANIQILTDPDSKVAAFSQGKIGKAKGIVLGQFGTETVFDKILHEEKIEEGDLVYTEGTEGNLARGLILGTVTKILEQENEVFKSAKIQPNFDIRDLELVFVIEE